MAEDVSLPIEVACKRRKLENDNPATNIDQGESFVHNELNGNFAVENGQEPQIYNPMRNDTEDESDNNGNDEIDDSASDISSISGFSEEEWQSAACSESLMMIQEKMMAGVNPRTILDELLPTKVQIPDDLDHFTMWKIIINIMSEPPRRKKLPNINTLGQVLELLNNSNKIMVLTGAGVSVSCGIPDFRSKDGIYARLAVDFPDLPDPQAMFDIRYFSKDPRPFFKFAKEIYPGQFEPSRSHKFIRLLEKQSKLLRNYTQNIDTLEQVAGISNVIQCHGSFATASCTKCKHKVDADAIKDDIFNQVIPKCPVCNPDVAEAEFGIMKPDIVFFGESLPEAFHKQMAADKDKCDLLIVIGSSLKVRPVALIPNSVPADVPQILINREPLGHMTFDIELLGDCDTIISELCVRLGWEGICDTSQKPMEQVGRDQLKTPMNGEETAGTSGLRIDADLPSSLSAANVHEEREPNIDHVNKRNKTMTSQLKVSDKQEKTCDNNISDSQCPAAISTITDGSALPTLNGNSDTDVFTDSVLDSDKSFEVDEDLEKIQTMGNPSEIDDELEEMRKMWEQRRESLAKLLEEKQFLFLPPCRYVFPGAEVYDEEDNHNDSDSSSSMSELSEDIQGKAETDPSQEMQNDRAIKKVAENEIGNEETEICDKVLMEKVSEKLNKHNVLIVPNSEEAASEQKAVSLETAFNSPEIASREISSSCDLQMQTGNTH